MISFDRRASDRRGLASSTTIGLGAVLADERRERRDRRQQLRRRSDAGSIAQVAHRISAGQTRLEMVVDGDDGMRLVAAFACGCSAVEPIGSGESSVHVDHCSAHAGPTIAVERRRHQR